MVHYFGSIILHYRVHSARNSYEIILSNCLTIVTSFHKLIPRVLFQSSYCSEKTTMCIFPRGLRTLADWSCFTIVDSMSEIIAIIKKNSLHNLWIVRSLSAQSLSTRVRKKISIRICQSENQFSQLDFSHSRVAAEFLRELVCQAGDAHHALRQAIAGPWPDAGRDHAEARLHVEARDTPVGTSTRRQSRFLALATGVWAYTDDIRHTRLLESVMCKIFLFFCFFRQKTKNNLHATDDLPRA